MQQPSDYPSYMDSNRSYGWMHDVARTTIVPTCMQAMGEPVALHVQWPPASTSESPVVVPGLIRVQEEDSRTYGQSVVLRADVFLEKSAREMPPDIERFLAAVLRLSFRGHHFTLVTVSPPTPDGLIKITAENVLRTVTNSPKLNSRR